jgi:D-alanyl-D-alanine carboxypeptidase
MLAACDVAYGGENQAPLPPEIGKIMEAPRYQGAIWGLRAIDLQSGQPVASLGSNDLFFTGSVRKLFSVGLALNALGPDIASSTRSMPTGRSARMACSRAISCWSRAAI